MKDREATLVSIIKTATLMAKKTFSVRTRAGSSVPAKNYQGVVNNIKTLLEKENAKYIDLSSVSDKAGAFNDLQHHSSYGGFLIY